MIFTKKTISPIIIAALTLLVLSGCKPYEGDYRIPSYLHLDRIDIVPQAVNAPSVEAGFYTSLIDAVELWCYFDGDDEETTIGTFQLPCTVPLLRTGKMEYIVARPVVKQNGVAAYRIYYSYYQPIVLEGIELAADSVTNLGTYDSTSGQWGLKTHYYERDYIDVLSEDYFEPTNFATNFDSTLTWVKNDSTNACTGRGYGLVEIPDSVTTRNFAIKGDFSPSSTQILYLEMDYRTNVDVYINMAAPATRGGTIGVKSVMCLYPNDRWQKIYINLGRTWSQFGYNTPVNVFFQAVNDHGIDGQVMIDNVKLIAM